MSLQNQALLFFTGCVCVCAFVIVGEIAGFLHAHRIVIVPAALGVVIGLRNVIRLWQSTHPSTGARGNGKQAR